MLITPTFIKLDNRLLKIIDVISDGNGLKAIVEIHTGVYLCGHWNFDNMITEKVNYYPCFTKQNPEVVAKRILYNQQNNIRDDWFLKNELEKPKKVFYKLDAWKDIPKEYEGDLHDLDAYGVVDNPEQLLEMYDFEKDPRKFVIALVCVKRKDQPSDGGWRYHKWGTCYSKQNPQHEYLYYDTHIDQVYTYHIYEII